MRILIALVALMAVMVAACGSSSGSSGDGGAQGAHDSSTGAPPPGRIFATFTFDSQTGYSGIATPLTNEPTYVVPGTTLANGVSVWFGDGVSATTRELTIILQTQMPLADGLAIPITRQQMSYTEDNSKPSQKSWYNDVATTFEIGHVDGLTFSFTVQASMAASTGGMGTFTMNGNGKITLCATDPSCFAND